MEDILRVQAVDQAVDQEDILKHGTEVLELLIRVLLVVRAYLMAAAQVAEEPERLGPQHQAEAREEMEFHQA